MVPVLNSLSENVLVNVCVTTLGSLERIRSPFSMSHKSCSTFSEIRHTVEDSFDRFVHPISKDPLTKTPYLRGQALIEGRTGFSMPQMAAPRRAAVQLCRISHLH